MIISIFPLLVGTPYSCLSYRRKKKKKSPQITHTLSLFCFKAPSGNLDSCGIITWQTPWWCINTIWMAAGPLGRNLHQQEESFSSSSPSSPHVSPGQTAIRVDTGSAMKQTARRVLARCKKTPHRLKRPLYENNQYVQRRSVLKRLVSSALKMKKDEGEKNTPIIGDSACCIRKRACATWVYSKVLGSLCFCFICEYFIAHLHQFFSKRFKNVPPTEVKLNNSAPEIEVLHTLTTSLHNAESFGAHPSISTGQ